MLCFYLLEAEQTSLYVNLDAFLGLFFFIQTGSQLTYAYTDIHS